MRIVGTDPSESVLRTRRKGARDGDRGGEREDTRSRMGIEPGRRFEVQSLGFRVWGLGFTVNTKP